MKKHLLSLAVLFLLTGNYFAQCVQNCGTYTVSPITFSTFPATGNDITAAFSPNNDDGYTSQLALGFSFNYFCTTYTSVAVCSNGYLVFGTIPSINGANPTQTLPDPATPNGMVALNMNDFDPSFGGTVTFTTIGTSPNQMFIVTYSNVPIWYNSATNTPSVPVYNTGQIVLYETSNDIEVHSASIGQSPYNMTQGIENQTGTVGMAAPGRNNSLWTTTNSAYRWSKTLIGATPTSVSGNTLLCFGDTATYVAAPMTGANSYSWTLPVGWQGTANSNTVFTTAGNPATLSVTATYSGCGTSTPAILTVSVMPPPVINVTGVSPPIVCSGNVVAINLSGGVNYTINPGAISGSAPLTLTTSPNTTYSVVGSSVDGCINPTPVAIPLTVNPTPTVTVNSGTICLGNSFTLNPSGAANYSFSSIFSVVTPSTTGLNQYLVIGTQANGCSATAVSTVFVNGLPSTSAVSSRTNICMNEVASFTASGASTYVWAHNNSTQATQTISPSTTASYSVTGTSALGCSRSAVITISVNFCTGVAETQAAQTEHFELFPNPARENVTLKTNTGGHATFYNLQGKQVAEAELAIGETALALAQLPAGYYLVRFVSNSGQEKRQVVIRE